MWSWRDPSISRIPPREKVCNFAPLVRFIAPAMNQPDEPFRQAQGPEPAEGQDDLWRLLGKARPPKVSPFFARNVLREVRGLRQEQPGFFAILRRRWQLTLATAAAGCIAVVAASQFLGGDLRNGQADPLAAIAQQVSESPDYYVINDLDDLLASEESSVWLDNPPH